MLASLVVLIGCGGPREKRVIVLTNGNSPYWDAVRAGMVASERDFKLGVAGLKAVMEVNDGTAQGQINMLRQFGSQSDIVAVAVSPLDANNQAVVDEMQKLQKRGVHVITLDGDLDQGLFRESPVLSPARTITLLASRREFVPEKPSPRRRRLTSISSAGLAAPGENAIERMDGAGQGRRRQFPPGAVGWATIPTARKLAKMSATRLHNFQN